MLSDEFRDTLLVGSGQGWVCIVKTAFELLQSEFSLFPVRHQAKGGGSGAKPSRTANGLITYSPYHLARSR